METDYRPRLTIEITPEQAKALNRIFRLHGSRRAFFSAVIDDVIQLHEEHGPAVIGAIVARQIGLEDYVTHS